MITPPDLLPTPSHDGRSPLVQVQTLEPGEWPGWLRVQLVIQPEPVGPYLLTLSLHPGLNAIHVYPPVGLTPVQEQHARSWVGRIGSGLCEHAGISILSEEVVPGLEELHR